MDFKKIKSHLFNDMFIFLYLLIILGTSIIVFVIWRYQIKNPCSYGYHDEVRQPLYRDVIKIY